MWIAYPSAHRGSRVPHAKALNIFRVRQPDDDEIVRGPLERGVRGLVPLPLVLGVQVVSVALDDCHECLGPEIECAGEQ